MYNIYITKVKNIRPAENADRLNLCEVFGNTTVVDKSINENDLYLYLPTDGQISVEFGEVNNLFRKKDASGNNCGGFVDPIKRNITAIRLRGNKSDGLVLPLSSLSFFGDISGLKEGDIVTVFNGHVIAEKYIPRSNVRRGHVTEGNKTRKKKVATAPLFKEHVDTEQLAYNLGAFKPGDEIEITLKMHGTSQRTGYLPVLQGYKRSLWEKITRKEGTPIYDWGYVSGTRRVVLENYEGGFYGDNQFREQHSKVFEGKLWKGETVYYEVVGFTTSCAPIMSSASNSKLQDKEFIKQYGKETVFSYGCEPCGFKVTEYDDPNVMPTIDYGVPQSDIYVYRMTMTNPDGEVVEYTPDFMRYRCEQMAVKTVPVFWRGFIPEYADIMYVDKNENDRPDNGEVTYTKPIDAGEWIMKLAERFYDGPDPVGKTHIREGVVVRIVNRPKFAAYKHKNFSFKVLEGIAKVEAEAPDMEEAQEVTE